MEFPENAARNEETAVEFVNIKKSFNHQEELIPVLNGISGKVPLGTILTIIGPSGAGKSTILSLCNLLITPEEGRIYVHGKDVQKWDVNDLRRQVGIAFQTAPMLDGTVLDNLLLPVKLHGMKLQEPEKYLEYVGLSNELLPRNAKELSGGQRQRLSLARTLINMPSVLLLDEVTAALDTISAHEIEELILRINQERHTTILWVTHDLTQAERVGEQTWLVMDGTIIESASTKEFFSKPKNIRTRHFLERKREN
ncbi:MAG: phosphate ABC transporter ATP-binding protein [Bacillota bacterium]|nr:phosphate ABC transporter ATP-binding protein [Bacillota bacterium]